MYHITEQNERRGRHQALLLTVTLHFALGVAVYLYANRTPDPQPTNTTFQTDPSAHVPRARTANKP